MSHDTAYSRGRYAPPAVLSIDQLQEVVQAVIEEGAFCFDVETRGNPSRHPDVMQLVKEEWAAKQLTLRTTNVDVLARSKKVIEEKWEKDLALDPLRNEVTWIGIAVKGRSWAIPMSHRNGETLTPAERGDGSTIPPPGYRTMLTSGKESLAKAKYLIPGTFAPPPVQLSPETVWEALLPLFMDETIPKIGHNIKFDARSVAKYLGGIPQGHLIDTMNLMHIVNENMLSYSLESVIHNQFEHWNPYYRDGKLGAHMETISFSKACYYVHLDARWTWLLYSRLLRRIVQFPTLVKALYGDVAATRPLAQMEHNGIMVNKREMGKLGKTLELQLNQILLDMSQYVPIGFSPDSVVHKRQLLFGPKKEGGLGLKSTKNTPGGAASVDSDVLEAFRGKHPVVDCLLAWQDLKKMKSTYVDGLLPMLHHGRLHPRFHLHRTSTGRLSSCVSGDTLLTTSRGTFRFDEYMPAPTDLVPTHTGAWKPVLRKIYKGIQPMVSVHLENGSVIQCTEEHKVLTPSGWLPVRGLEVGSEIVSYVGVKEVYGRSAEHQNDSDSVFGIAGQTNDDGDIKTGGNYLPQRLVHPEAAHRRGASASGTGSTLLALQVGEEESNDWEVRGGPPQFHWVDQRWSWLFDAEGRWEVRARASSCVCGGAWHGEAPPVVGCASHQRGQDGQSLGQPCVGDFLGPRAASSEVSKVISITPLGEMGVWDIEVADDHSYVTHGFVNHNSGPNLQNIPRDGEVRSLFTCEPDSSLLDADYDQIELRIMAMFSGDKNLTRIFTTGIDVHSGTAGLILGKNPDDVTGEERTIYGKVPNFLMGYGGGAKKLVQSTNGVITLDQAKDIIKDYDKAYSGMTAWKRQVVAAGMHKGYVETLSGRRRRLPDLNLIGNSEAVRIARSKAERQAVNAVVQGTAAEMCKRAIVAVDKIIEFPKVKLLLQVHDELVLSVPTDELHIWEPRLLRAMGDGDVIMGIPVKVSAGYAGSWYDAKG